MTESAVAPQGQSITDKKQLLPADLGSKQAEETGCLTTPYSWLPAQSNDQGESQEPGRSTMLGIILDFLLPPKQNQENKFK